MSLTVIGVLLVAAVLALAVTMGLAAKARLTAGADRINTYYMHALGTWLLRNDQAARQAALTAAKVAASDQRESMLSFLPTFSSELSHDAETRRRFDVLLSLFAEEVRQRDWTIRDVRNAKKELWSVRPEYAKALDRSDASVFKADG